MQICKTEEIAFEYERAYIEQVKAYENNKYYNIHFGGNGFSSENVKLLWENDEYREKVSSSRKKLWEDNAFREKEIKRRKEVGRNPEFIKKVSEASKKRWAKKDYRDKQIKKFKEIMSNPEIQKKRAEALRGRALSVEHIEKIRLSNIGKNKGSKSSLSKPVMCLNTKEIFESTRIAGERYNCDNSRISKSCNNVLKISCGKLNGKRLFWIKLEDFNKLDKEEKSNLVKRAKNYKFEMSLDQKNLISNNMKKRSGKNHSQATKIICLNTLEVFDYIKQATKIYGINNTCIANCCKGKQKSAGKINGEPAKWMYYEDYIKLNNSK